MALEPSDELPSGDFDLALAGRMLQYLRPYRRLVLGAVGLLSAGAGLVLVGPVSG